MEVVLMKGAAAVGQGASVRMGRGKRTFQAKGTANNVGNATIKIQGSNVTVPAADTDWVDIGTIILNLVNGTVSDGFASDAPWANVRGNCTAITGAIAASVDVLMGIEG